MDILDLIYVGSLEEVVEYLDNDGDIDIISYDGRSPLYIACEGGHIDMVKVLLDRGDIDIDVGWWTNLHPILVSYNQPNILRTLIDYGMNVNVLDAEGYTTLMLATIQRHTECVSILLSHPDIDVDILNDHGKTAMDYADIQTLSIFNSRGRSLYQCRDRSKSYMSSFADISILIV